MFRVRFFTVGDREVVKLLRFVEVEGYLYELLCCLKDGGVDRFDVRIKRGCRGDKD